MNKAALMAILMSTVSILLGSSSMAQAIEVHGHRGARARFPENTIPAFEHALKASADALEMDLNVTKDGVLVVHHDTRINRDICLTAGGTKIKNPILIFETTLDELKKLDCGSVKHPDHAQQTTVPGTHIPTFEEVLNWLASSKLPQAKTIRLNVETKISPEEPKAGPPPKEFVQLVIDLLKKKNFLKRTVLQSFDYRTLIEARKIEPSIQIAALSDNSREDLVQTAKDLRANYISPKWQMVQFKLVESLHANGVKVLPWTVNDRLGWAHLIAMGVDGIITDDPERLIEFIRSGK